MWLISLLFITWSSPQVLVDRIVASVDKKLITLSEIQQIALIKCLDIQGDACLTLPLNADILENARQHAIYEQLIINAASHAYEPIVDLQINERIAFLQSKLSSPDAFNQWMARAHLSMQELKDLIKRMQQVALFLENRIRFRIEITQEDIAHYKTQHPKLFDEEIKAQLKQEAFNQRTQAYVKDLAKNADIKRIGRLE